MRAKAERREKIEEFSTTYHNRVLQRSNNREHRQDYFRMGSWISSLICERNDILKRTKRNSLSRRHQISEVVVGRIRAEAGVEGSILY